MGFRCLFWFALGLIVFVLELCFKFVFWLMFNVPVWSLILSLLRLLVSFDPVCFYIVLMSVVMFDWFYLIYGRLVLVRFLWVDFVNDCSFWGLLVTYDCFWCLILIGGWLLLISFVELLVWCLFYYLFVCVFDLWVLGFYLLLCCYLLLCLSDVCLVLWEWYMILIILLIWCYVVVSILGY